MTKIDQTTILGIKIDKVTENEALEKVRSWLKGGKHTIFTPNIEFIMAAQKNPEFKKILNRADLSIPDSARFGWSDRIIREKSLVKKILLWPLFPFSKILFREFPVVPGVDLMEKLCSKSNEWAFTVGLLGGNEGVADRAAECLREKYPGLKVAFTSSGGEIDQEGEAREGGKPFIHHSSFAIPKTDILFVAFGQVKQEKWIAKRIKSVDAKVFMGVGGAFDYLSGEIPRAPLFMRALGMEWLFRLIRQPWRIKRFGALVKYVFLLTREPAI